MTGATIIGFDIPISQILEGKLLAAGIILRLHKLIYKFTDDISDLVNDVKLRDARAKGEGKDKNVIGSAQILQIFSVTAGKKMQTVFGTRILTG